MPEWGTVFRGIVPHCPERQKAFRQSSETPRKVVELMGIEPTASRVRFRSLCNDFQQFQNDNNTNARVTVAIQGR